MTLLLQGRVRGTPNAHNVVQRGATPRPATKFKIGAVEELADSALGSVIPHAAGQTKRVAPDVIAPAEQGPRSIAGSNPACAAIYFDGTARLVAPRESGRVEATRALGLPTGN